MFVKRIIDSTKVEHISKVSRSTFYRKTNWCWDFIFVDATYLNKNLCLLIVRNENYVLNFKWADKENFDNYYDLLKEIDEPRFIICDGHAGIAKASLKLWRNARIQRCLVHIVHSAERKLGKRSPSEINQIFRRHISRLTGIDTLKKSENWSKKFHALYDEHKSYIEEFSLSINEETGELIRRFRTHKNLFSVCNEINTLLSKNRLFLFVEHNIPNNSNYIEGGINSPLKNLLRCHRGITLEHQMRMLE